MSVLPSISGFAALLAGVLAAVMPVPAWASPIGQSPAVAFLGGVDMNLYAQRHGGAESILVPDEGVGLASIRRVDAMPPSGR
jgi:hypothetical protein